MSMILTVAALAALQTSAEAAPRTQASPVQLSAESNAALRCSAAFALISYGQANGNEAAGQWPALDDRGREFFVRTMARIMDETGADRDAAAKLVEREAQRLLESGEVEQIMPACLAMLDMSGI